MLELRNLSFAYGPETTLAGVDLTVPRGQFVSLLGPSGSGKTTLLRLVAGLQPPTSGTIRWNGAPLGGPSLRRAIVFQDYSLFPWMTLRQNVELAIRKARPEQGRAERRETAEGFLGLVGLGGDSSKYPHELSGGMRQRGAIARAFAMSSEVLLLDEPFGALDPVNRARLQDLLLEIWAASTPRKTVLLVTHDVDEALLLGNRVVVLGSAPGRVIADIPVPFPHPRSRRTLFASRDYVELEEQIAAHYRLDVIERIERPDLVAGAGDRI
ncbi:MAG TPA: ABC transporter ATP-binding protein [Anaeromyxobacteraceae bacterium]|nr:ABC transporter ATP-binding protein [Anaeromyxobacteraceae bacterium]